MKPKKKRNKRFFARTKTIFASSLIRFTKGVRLFINITDRPASEYPKTQEQREALRPQLYLQLRLRIEKLIAAQKELEAHCKGMKNPLANDPSKCVLSATEHFREIDVMELWALLEKFGFLPIDTKRGVKWPSWKSFARSVRRDNSVFDRIEQTAYAYEGEELCA